jgi:hypothetical protein
MFALQAAEQQRETLGVELYGCQQQLAKAHTDLVALHEMCSTESGGLQYVEGRVNILKGQVTQAQGAGQEETKRVRLTESDDTPKL